MVFSDKLIFYRSIMFGVIFFGKMMIINFLRGEDCLSILVVFCFLGVNIEDDGMIIIVEG